MYTLFLSPSLSPTCPYSVLFCALSPFVLLHILSLFLSVISLQNIPFFLPHLPAVSAAACQVSPAFPIPSISPLITQQYAKAQTLFATRFPQLVGLSDEPLTTTPLPPHPSVCPLSLSHSHNLSLRLSVCIIRVELLLQNSKILAQ